MESERYGGMKGRERWRVKEMEGGRGERDGE